MSDTDAVHKAAQVYSDAVYCAQAEVFETLCHDAFHMVCADDGQVWDKASYLARVRGRSAAPGAPVHDIRTVEVDGDMARVKLRVGIPGVVFEDYLGFIRVDGDWKLINKLFRDVTPAQDG